MTSSLLTPAEAATLLAISKRRLYRLTEAGLIPAVRLGRSLRFTPEVLEALIAGGGVGGVRSKKPTDPMHDGPGKAP